MRGLRFLRQWRKTRGRFIRPRLRWYFGLWYRDPNLPVWRRGNIIRFGKYKDTKEEWEHGHMTGSEWTDEGKRNHPFLSRIFRPSYELPVWMSVYFFDNDIIYKTKNYDCDYRYEFPASITLVLFGLSISVTAYIPEDGEKDFTCQDDYWESLLTYNHFGGDLESTNTEMGWWGVPGEDTFSFRFKTRFLTVGDDRVKLDRIQYDTISSLKEYLDESDDKEQEKDK